MLLKYKIILGPFKTRTNGFLSRIINFMNLTRERILIIKAIKLIKKVIINSLYLQYLSIAFFCIITCLLPITSFGPSNYKNSKIFNSLDFASHKYTIHVYFFHSIVVIYKYTLPLLIAVRRKFIGQTCAQLHDKCKMFNFSFVPKEFNSQLNIGVLNI